MPISLVTGGAGFIGSHLVEGLLRRGYDVRVLDDLSTGRRSNLAGVEDRIEFARGSITDPWMLAGCMEGVDTVFHLAALPSVQRSVEAPEMTHEVCATGTLRVLQAARQNGVRRVVYAASSSAYGDTPGVVRSESDATAPLSPYAVAKLAGELYCRCYATVYGLETVRLRFFNIFGPRQDPHSPYAGVIARFIDLGLNDQPVTIFGSGEQSRDFTFVDNAVHAMIQAATAPGVSGRVYNVGAGGRASLLDLVAALAKILRTRLQVVHGEARVGDVQHSQADIGRACRELGYAPAVSFMEGLERTVSSHRH